MATIQAVVFDKDGTLQNTEHWRQAASRVVLERMGHVPPLDVLTRMIGTTKEDGDALLKSAIPSLDTELFRAERSEVLRKFYDRPVVATNRVPSMPGAVETLRALRHMGLKVGVATGTLQDEAVQELRLGGMTELIDCVVGRDKVQDGKPSPEIFLKAAKQLGVAPENCVAVGDTDFDVKSASMAGMKVVLIPDRRECSAEVQASAHLVCDSLYEFMEKYRTGWSR